MALCHNCDDARIEYTGNGSQTDYTFPFEYNEKGDVGVANWNETLMVWEPVPDGWVFLNDTTIRFDEAPAFEQKFIIYRCTDLSPLPAEFYPGTPIKAQDLNDNFFVLKSAIEEARCAIQRNDEKAEGKYWNKLQYDETEGKETVYSTQRWVSTDNAVASTAAIDNRLEEDFDEKRVTRYQQRQGRWIHNGENDDNDHVASTAAITERLDPYFQDNVPYEPNYQIPGKLWFDNDRVQSAVWDQENRTWVSSGLSGPPGPIGLTGTYKTIVSDSAPTRRVDNTPLENGDVWFNSSTAELFIWYDDGQPDNARGKQWIAAISGTPGPQGPKGDPGTGTYIFNDPITETGNEVNFNVSLLNQLP